MPLNDIETQPPPVRQSESTRKEPNRYCEWVYVATNLESPLTYQEAMQNDDHGKWKLAMEIEMKSLRSIEI